MTQRESNRSALQEEAEFGFPRDDLRDIAVDPVQSNTRKIEHAKLLWEHRRLIGRIIALGTVIAAIVAVLIPSQYTSTVRLMPPDQGAAAGMGMLATLASKAEGSIGGLGADLLGLKTSGELFIGILQSRTVQDAVINKVDLRKAYGIARWDDTRKLLSKRTSISEDRKSGILTIAVSDHLRERAKAIGEEYVTQLNQVVTSLNTSSAHREREFLEERLKDVQQDLDIAQKEFSEFASKNTTIDLQAQSKAMIESGASLTGQLAAAQTELEGLRQIYANGNVRVREVQARVDELQKQLLKLGGPSTLTQSTANQSQTKEPNALYPPIRELPILGVTYADLYRHVKTQEAVFETLTQEYELAKVQEAKETPSVKILDPADLPERKSFPPRTAIVFLGALLAFALSVIWIFAECRWRSIDAHHPGKKLVIEVLQSLPAQWTAGFRSGTPNIANGNGAGSTQV